MNPAIVSSMIRTALVAIGGIGLGEGELQQVCGALSILFCVAWSVWEKRRNGKI